MPEHTDEIPMGGDEPTQPGDIAVHDATAEKQIYKLVYRMLDNSEKSQDRQSQERREAAQAHVAALNASTTAQVEALKGVQKEVRNSTWISFGAVCLLAVALTGGNFALKVMGVDVSAGPGSGSAATGTVQGAASGATAGVPAESDSADDGGGAGS